MLSIRTGPRSVATGANSQVKIRGFHTKLAEFESVLMRCEHVRSAACTLREDALGLQQLVGYVASRYGRVDEEFLRSHFVQSARGLHGPGVDRACRRPVTTSQRQ